MLYNLKILSSSHIRICRLATASIGTTPIGTTGPAIMVFGGWICIGRLVGIKST